MPWGIRVRPRQPALAGYLTGWDRRWCGTTKEVRVSNALPLLPPQKSDGIYTVSDPVSLHRSPRKSAEEGGTSCDFWKTSGLAGWVGALTIL